MTKPATEEPRPPQVRTPDGFVRRRNGLAVARITQPARPCAGMPRILREARPRERFRSWSAPLPHRFSLDHRKSASIEDSPWRTLQRFNAFTLLELLIVVGIIGLLMVLIVPAFTTIKGGGDVTSAAYTIKGVLDTARTYAKANNTYTWVGFYEEDVSTDSTNPASPGVGRVVMSIVASKDGTNVATTNPIDPTKLIQVGKLTKVENIHLATSLDGTNLPPGSNSPPGETFDTRPTVTSTYCLGDTTSSTPFQYPLGASQYTFSKVVQFGTSGEARLSNSQTTPQVAAEIGLRPTHGAAVDINSPNLVAIQFTGLGGNVRIYRR